MQTLVISRVDALNAVSELWDLFRETQPLFVPRFRDLVGYLTDTGRDFRLIALKDGEHIVSVGCFVLEHRYKRFSVRRQQLFQLPIRQLNLFGSTVLGKIDPTVFRHFVKVVASELDFDLIHLGEIPIDCALWKAVHGLSLRFVVTSPSRKASLRWLINLPENFEQYLASLSSKLRKSLRYQMRKLQNDLKCELVVVHRIEQIDQFLQDGESVSRLTYQWNIGQRLNNDDATRHRYIQRAKDGELRCYIVYTSGKPIAFARGALLDSTYIFETPGYDPRYSKYSVGLVLLLWVIRDLIQNTTCKIFDFGEGGDEIDYKSRFGNANIRCKSMEIGRWTSPRSLAIITLQEALSAAKNVINWLISR
jgi:hypothetical protein